MTKQESLVFLYVSIFCCTVVAVVKLHLAYILFLFHHWIQLFAWLSSIFMITGMYVAFNAVTSIFVRNLILWFKARHELQDAEEARVDGSRNR